MTTPQDADSHRGTAGSHRGTQDRRRNLMPLLVLLAALVIGLTVWAVAAELAGGEDPGAAPATEGAQDAEPAPGPEATEDADVAEPTVTEPATTPSAEGAGVVLVGGVDVLAGGPELITLIGEPVEATGVEVREVVADEAFYVGPGEGQVVLVRLLPSAAGETSVPAVTVEEGDVVSFTGTLRGVDPAVVQGLQDYQPSEDLQMGQVYVEVEEIADVG